MKLYVQLMVLLFALCKMTNVFADDTPGIYCLDTNTGMWGRFGAGVEMDRQVNIGTTRQYPSALQANARAYPMSNIFLQCRNSMTDDAQYSMRIRTVYRSNANYSPGLINNGYISYAYTGNQSFSPTNYETITLPARNALRTLQIDPSLVLHYAATAIPTSGSLGVFEYVIMRNGVIQTNLTMRINLIAQSDIVFQPETCTVNNGLPINVDLGTMSPSDIPITTGSLQSGRSQEISLAFSCEDKTSSSRVSVQLVGQQSTFSQTVVEARSGEVAGTGTTIENLGVEFYHEGIALRPNIKTGGFTTQITNGTGLETIVVSAVKSPDAVDIDLPAGYFNATATLVLVLP